MDLHFHEIAVKSASPHGMGHGQATGPNHERIRDSDWDCRVKLEQKDTE